MSEERGKKEANPFGAGEIVNLDAIQQPYRTLSPEHAHFCMSADMNAAAMLDKIHQGMEEENPPSFTAMLLHIVGKSLLDFPLLNGTFVSETALAFHPHVHVAVAIDSPSGLQFPVMADVNARSVSALHDDIKRLTEEAKNRRFSEEETSGATFTVVNLGMFGIAQFNAVLHSSQVAALAVGAIAYRLVMTGNRIINLPFFTATLTCDARVIDAAMAAKFLQRAQELVEEE